VTASVLPYRRVVAALFGTLKLMQMYGRNHDATGEGLRSLSEAIHAALEEGETAVAVRGHRLQVNSRGMRASDCGNLAISYLAQEWGRRGIESIHFLAEVTPDELGAFVHAFLTLDLTQPDPADRLGARCAAEGCARVRIHARIQREEDPVVLEDRRHSAMRSYLRGLRAFREVLRYDGFQDRRNLRRARRAVQGLVDRFLEDENAVLALAQVRGYDIKLFHHCLNVSIYALLIGQRLGMNRRQLGELGLAGLLHDVGKTLEARRSGPSKGTRPAVAWEIVQAHPARGAHLLLEEGMAHEGMLKAVIAAYEHHAHVDGGGFPELSYDPHMVSRIVALADCYEALTSTRTYREVPYAAYDAIALLQSQAGTLFDPVLLKVFVSALGIYPVGSLVELTTGEVGIVVEGPCEPEHLDRPRVRVLAAGDGPQEPDLLLDLGECDESGAPVRTITRTLPPGEVFDTVGDYVSAL